MMIRKSDGEFVQETPELIWTIPIPEGRIHVEIIGVYTEDGRTAIPFDTSTFTDGVLTVYMGLDPVTGVVRYEYDVEDTTTVVTGDGGVINIYQYNYPKA